MERFEFSSSPESPQKYLEHATEAAENIQYAPGFSYDAVRFLRMKSDEQPTAFFARLRSFFQGEEVKDEASQTTKGKFGQLAPEAQQLITETIEQRSDDAHPNEFEALLLTLAVTPKPEAQKKLCEEVRDVLDKERNQELRDEIIMRVKLESALDALLENLGNGGALPVLNYYFHASAAERAMPESKQRIHKALQYELIHLVNRTDYQNNEFAKYFALDANMLAAVIASLPDPPTHSALRLVYYAKLSRKERELPPYKESIAALLKEPWDSAGDRMCFGQWHESIITYLTEISTQDDFLPEESELLRKTVDKLTQQLDAYSRDPGAFQFLGSKPDMRTAKALLTYYASFNPEQRQMHQERISDILKLLDIRDRETAKIIYDYTSSLTPAERQAPAMQEAIKQALSLEDGDMIKNLFLDFYRALPADEQQLPVYQKEMKRLLKKKPSGKGDINELGSGNVLSLLAALPRDEREDVSSKRLIRQALIRNDSNYYLVDGFFTKLTPEERIPSPLAMAVSRRIRSALAHEIGDVELREEYADLVLNRIGDESSSIIALDKLENPRNRVCLASGLAALGFDTTAALSWQLTEEQESSLRYAVSRLARDKQNHDLLKGVTLPFRPRDNKVAGFERGLDEWFRGLDFLNALGDQLHARSLLIRHVAKIKKLEHRFDIQHATRDIPLSLLKGVVGELHTIKEKITQNFCQLTGLENISPEKFDALIDRWGGNIASVLTFAQRLHKGGLDDVKKEFSTYISAEIEGNWEKKRYDLTNMLTREQLIPLIGGKDATEQDAVIQTYHHGVLLIHAETIGTEMKKEPVGPFIVSEELKQRLSDDYIAHHHFEEVFSVSELAALDQTGRDMFQRFVLSALYPKEEVKLHTPKELKNHFAGKIPEPYLDAAIKLRQFFVDFFRSQKPAGELSQGLERIIAKLPEPMQKLAFIKNDLAEYVGATLRAATAQRTVKERKQVFISRTTDHPKVLLEIGKFPANSGSCQNYDYANLQLAKSLPGYMEDGHIQAIVISELVSSEEPAEIIAIDEGRRQVEARMADGSIAHLAMSEPIDRAMMMIGTKDKEAVITVQPHYAKPGVLDKDLAKFLADNTVKKLIDVLQEEHELSLRMCTADESGIQMAGSHNPAGHYNDIMRGQQGQNGKSYVQGRVPR